MRNNSSSQHRRLKPVAVPPESSETPSLSHMASLKQLESRNLSKGLYLSSEVYNQEAFAS